MAARARALAAGKTAATLRLSRLSAPLLLLLPVWPPPAAAARVSSAGAAVWRPGAGVRRPAAALLAASLAGANVTREVCWTPVKGHPSEIDCPTDCPYLRAEPTETCSFACVPPDHCPDDDPLASFPNPETRRCEGCGAVACVHCATSVTCAKCQEGFRLSSTGECTSANEVLWWVLYVVIVLIVAPIAFYVVMLPLRPNVNPKALDQGLAFRESCKLRHPETDEPYSLLMNLGRQYTAGIGVMLHFKWQQCVIVWTFVVLLIYWVLSLFFNKRPSAVKHEMATPQAFAACERGIMRHEKEFVQMEKVYYFATWAVYLCSTVGCLAFAINQRRIAHRTQDTVASMIDFMLRATGVPVQKGTAAVEQELLDFFRRSFPDLAIVGVSVCWSLSADEAKWVQEMQEKEVFELDSNFREQLPRCHQRSVSRASASFPARPKEVRPSLYFQCFDRVFGIGPHLCDHPENREQPWEEVEAKLRVLDTSGTAFVVFDTERDRERAYERTRGSPLKFDNTHTIKLQKKQTLPDAVNWENFGVGFTKMLCNVMLGNVAIFVAVIVLDLFFYAPYVVYILMHAKVLGLVGGGFVQGTLLGLLITACNQIIYLLIGVIADRCGFRYQGGQRQFYVVQYTAAVFFNTCIDLWTVGLLARGFSIQDVAVKMQDPLGAMGDNGIFSPKAIVENPTVQRTVYSQLLSYLFPGCLLLPFVLEPLAFGFIFFQVPQWLVQSRWEVNPAEAERRLVMPDFDLSRYGDILVNVMLCSVTLAFTYRDVYQMLLVSLLIIYAWDHFRFLRCTRHRDFPSPKMENTVQWLCAVPCAILAGALVFRSWGAMDDGFLVPVKEQWTGWVPWVQLPLLNNAKNLLISLSRKTIFWHMALAVACHLAFHFSCLYWVVPLLSEVRMPHDDTVKYSDVAARDKCDWFNTNPVHCLRSKYILKEARPCIPYSVGKEYLLEQEDFAAACKTTPSMRMRRTREGGWFWGGKA